MTRPYEVTTIGSLGDPLPALPPPPPAVDGPGLVGLLVTGAALGALGLWAWRRWRS